MEKAQSDIFELMTGGDLSTIREAIAAEPRRARARNSAGLSVILVALTVGNRT